MVSSGLLDIYANQTRFFVDSLVHEGVEYGLIGPRETKPDGRAYLE